MLALEHAYWTTHEKRPVERLVQARMQIRTQLFAHRILQVVEPMLLLLVVAVAVADCGTAYICEINKTAFTEVENGGANLPCWEMKKKPKEHNE